MSRLDKSNVWSSTSAAIPLLTSLRKFQTAENNDELALLQSSRVLVCCVQLRPETPTKKHPSSSVSANSNTSPLNKGVCYLLGFERNVTPLGPWGLMLRFVPRSVLGDRPAFKFPNFVPIHYVSLYLLDSLCYAWSRTDPFKMLPPMPGIERVVSHTMCGMKRCEDSRHFDSERNEFLMDVCSRNLIHFLHPCRTYRSTP